MISNDFPDLKREAECPNSNTIFPSETILFEMVMPDTDELSAVHFAAELNPP